ncbi:MAG: hypothetical protein Q9169_001326 [Polycauliona sp. 2 TL-2023]
MSSDILPPVSEVTPTNHGALVLITNGFGLCLVLIFTIIRVFARLFINPPFDRDDLLMGVATLLAIIYSALLFSLVSKGFGRAQDLLSPGALVAVQKVCPTLAVAAISRPPSSLPPLSSFIRQRLFLPLHRLGLEMLHGPPFHKIDASPGSKENGASVENNRDHLAGVIVRWDIIGAIDIATEAALFGMSILLVKDLKMDVSKKTFVVVAFGLRLPMIAFTILRITSAQKWFDSTDLSYGGVYFIIWSIVESHFSICSSNIACLKPFIAAFNTSFGGSAGINELSRMERSTGNSGSGTLKSIKGFASRRNKSNKDSSNVMNSMNQHHKPGTNNPSSQTGTRSTSRHHDGKAMEMGNEVDIIHEDTGSIGSGGSRQMIIQKDVTWDVEYSTPANNKPAKGRLRGGAGQYNP